MNYIILDIEWNGAYSALFHGYFNEIIEIGAVKLDENACVISEFSENICPVVSQKLTHLVKELTGIEDSDLCDGGSFEDVITHLDDWIADPSAVVMTWSTTDLLVLLENCRYFLHKDYIPFMSRYMDLQAYCQEFITPPTPGQQLGLGKACQMLDISNDELSQHRALDDSILSSKVFSAVFNKETVLPSIFDTNIEFYDRLCFKTTVVNDISSEHIKDSDLIFNCEGCGTALRLKKEWGFRGRAFRTEMECEQCGIIYNARLQVKLKYDGSVISRALTVKPPVENETEEACDEKEKEDQKNIPERQNFAEQGRN